MREVTLVILEWDGECDGVNPAIITQGPSTKQAPAKPAPVQEAPKPVAPPPPSAKPVVSVRFPITVGDLAQKMNRKIPEVIKALMGIGIFANVNQLLNEEIVYAAGGALGPNRRQAR